LVEAAVGVGAMLFPPGSDFFCVDTGYVLTGIAIERLLDRPLAVAYREPAGNGIIEAPPPL
jgi:hypothetical protein